MDGRLVLWARFLFLVVLNENREDTVYQADIRMKKFT